MCSNAAKGGSPVSVIESFLSVVFNSSASILFAALGILLMHLSGVVNIGAEGMMLIGAFSGVVGSYLTGNVWLGALFAMVVTGIVGLVYGYCTITYKANQVVTGIAFNILAIGVTTTLYRIVFGMNSSTMKVESFPRLGSLSAPVYLGFLAVLLMSAKALLDENPHPGRDEIRTAIAGNLCRCTGYEQIIDAIEDAAVGEETPWKRSICPPGI